MVGCPFFVIELENKKPVRKLLHRLEEEYRGSFGLYILTSCYSCFFYYQCFECLLLTLCYSFSIQLLSKPLTQQTCLLHSLSKLQNRNKGIKNILPHVLYLLVQGKVKKQLHERCYSGKGGLFFSLSTGLQVLDTLCK